MIMKTFLVSVACLGLALATLNIPLKTQKIYAPINGVSTNIDTILYTTSSVTNLGSTTKIQDENVIFDLIGSSNYVISKSTRQGTTATSPVVCDTAFDCNGQCDNPDKKITTSVSILGGKASFTGGSVLKNSSTVTLEDDVAQSEFYLSAPEQIDSIRSSEFASVLSFANLGISLRDENGLISQLEKNSNLVDDKTISVYVHDTVSQLNIGGQQPYLVQPNSPAVTVQATNGWVVPISGIRSKNGSLLNGATSVNANFDLTSKYIYVPQTANFKYFMTDKELPCFKPDTNLVNKLSFVCPAGQFPGYDQYSPLTFTFKGTEANSQFEAVFNPTDYIQKNDNGDYELLFRFAQAPQNTNEFYLGTSFLNIVYPTFNYNDDTVTLAKKFNIDSPANGLHLDDNYRLPIIIVGSLLALFSVIALLAILKKVKLDNGSFNSQFDIPTYQRNSHNQSIIASPSYQPAPVNTSVAYQTQTGFAQVNPIATQSVYSIAQPVVQNQVLRQSQVQAPIRQSQNIIRNVQTTVQNTNYQQFY